MPQQTVTINGEDYPVPEDCKWFYCDDNHWFFRIEGDTLQMILSPVWEPERDAQVYKLHKRWLPLIAAVAVMHFNNRAEKLPHGPSATVEQMRAFGKMIKAAAQWRELTTEI